jgi:hypothetical protein
LGAVFVTLGKERIDGESLNLTTVDLGNVASIHLRLIEVHWYRRMIGTIPGGHTAGIRLEGTGLDILEDALASKGKREFLWIRT